MTETQDTVTVEVPRKVVEAVRAIIRTKEAFEEMYDPESQDDILRRIREGELDIVGFLNEMLDFARIELTFD